MSKARSDGSADGAGRPRTTRRDPRSPRQWSPWPRSASCSTASPIPIAGDCPPHNFRNGLSDEEKAEELNATDRKKYLEGTVAAKAAEIGWKIVSSSKEN